MFYRFKKKKKKQPIAGSFLDSLFNMFDIWGLFSG